MDAWGRAEAMGPRLKPWSSTSPPGMAAGGVRRSKCGMSNFSGLSGLSDIRSERSGFMAVVRVERECWECNCNRRSFDWRSALRSG